MSRSNQKQTTARQLIGWLSGDKTNAKELAERIERSVARSKPGLVALTRLFSFDEALDRARKPKTNLAKKFMEDFARYEKIMPANMRSTLLDVLTLDDSFDMLEEFNFSI